MRATMPLLLAACAVALAACGGGSSGNGGAERPAAAGARAPARTAHPWLYVWRNFELTGIPEEVSIARDGGMRYRNLLHTQRGIPVRTGRLRPAQLAGLRRLLARVDLRATGSAGVRPRRDGYRWVIRFRGVTATAADGHLRGALRSLVGRLRAVMDRLQEG
jgi:hypothetical protein